MSSFLFAFRVVVFVKICVVVFATGVCVCVVDCAVFFNVVVLSSIARL